VAAAPPRWPVDNVSRGKSSSTIARAPRRRVIAGAGRGARAAGPVRLTPARRREITGIALVALGVLGLVGFVSRGGSLTELWVGATQALFGWGAGALPLLVGGLGAWLMLRGDDDTSERRWSQPAGAIALFVAVLGLAHLLAATTRIGDPLFLLAAGRELAEAHRGGGWTGYAIVRVLAPVLGVIPSAALLIVLAGLSASLAAGLTVNQSAALLARGTRRGLRAAWLYRPRLAGPSGWSIGRWAGGESSVPPQARSVGPTDPAVMPAGPLPPNAVPPRASPETDPIKDPSTAPAPGAPSDWRLPSIESMLEPAVEVERSPEEAESMARTIEGTLAEFGIPVKVVKINTGPTITQFGLKPGYIERAGGRMKVTVRRIVALQNDLALALAASPIRVLAPVPGRPYVGVEIPNAAKALVSLRGVMESEGFRGLMASGGLPLGLGRDTSGQPVAADLTRMPHLLVAGATGAGKSVCINALIVSLLLTHTPDRLKLVLVDPKRVEMTQYRGLPHLATPVVVEVERVVGVLQWAVREMDRRYRTFAEAGARNIDIYNRLQAERRQPELPYLVIIIDELADLMMLAPDDTERLITRLAQLARATGIHLILATQRPSVDVVTGLIKANFPSRIAFAVSSSIDSRVILDAVGADKLLGRGDMLYMASDDSKLRRLQGCFVSDAEIERLVHYWKYAAKGDGASGSSSEPRAAASMEVPEPLIQPELWDQMLDPKTGALAEARDPLWDEAVALIRTSRAASTSFLQRKLRIGYSRAARLMDELEAAGLIGPAQGNGPREVRMDADAPVEAPDDFKTRLDRVFGVDEARDGEGRDGGEPPYDDNEPPDDDGVPDDDASAIRPWLGT